MINSYRVIHNLNIAFQQKQIEKTADKAFLSTENIIYDFDVNCFEGSSVKVLFANYSKTRSKIFHCVSNIVIVGRVDSCPMWFDFS